MGFDGVPRASGVGCWSWLDGKVEWDETTRLLFDRPESPADYAAYLACIHPDDRPAVHTNIERFVREARYEDIEHRVLLSEGRTRWLFARGTAVFDDQGELRGLQGIVLDITDLKRREELLVTEAETDPLTGLRNRRWLNREGPREVARCEREASPFSLAFIDVNDFKRVNDGPGGHAAGDRLLVAVTACLRAQLRLGDVMARIGGDELVALLPQTTPEEANGVARRLTQAVAGQPLDGIWSTVSVGVSTWAPGDQFDSVLRRADRAMYRLKESKAAEVAGPMVSPPSECPS